jgi:hypothetical protein
MKQLTNKQKVKAERIYQIIQFNIDEMFSTVFGEEAYTEDDEYDHELFNAVRKYIGEKLTK